MQDDDAQFFSQVTALLSAVPDSLVVIDPQTVQYLAVNDAACRFGGLTREEMMARGPAGMAATANLDFSVDILRRRYLDLVESYPEVKVQEGTAVRGGQPIAVEFHRQAVPIAGRWVVTILTVPLGVQPRRPSNEAAFRNLLDLSADAVALLDAQDLRVVDVNDAAVRLLGHGRAALLAGGLELMAGSAAATELAALAPELIAQSPRPRVVEATLTRMDGTQVPVQITQQAVDDHSRWLVILTARDITERVEARRALEQRVRDLARSNEELERFAYVASHDLLEPLRMIASYAQLLERRYRPHLDSDAHEFIGFIVGGARRMKLLLDDLLAYARVGRRGGAPAPVALDEVLDDVLDNLQVLIAEKHAVIEREPLPTVHGVRTELLQVLQNLVGNALKFHAPGRSPVIRIRADRDDTAWTIHVQDNGIGIAPEHFERIFVIFQRLHGRETYAGTGVGLAVCKKIVESHGGRIGVESQPGAGTRFHFTLPHARAWHTPPVEVLPQEKSP
jgi:PAS domain S-box-containing protein